MYGLLLENLATFIKQQWGEGKWESVRRHAGIDLVAFSIHHVYPETLMRRIARSAFQVLGVDERQFFKAMGVYFVQYVSQYGYDQLLSVLGRHLRDFLNGLDNLHEYLKFSYPKMRAPSFYCDDESESGLKLHYRSKRRGFVYYVMGQIKQVAKQFYNQECNIHLLTEEVVGEMSHVTFSLAFDNSAFSEAEELKTLIGKDLRLPVRASTLFELFPFCIVFNSDMEITHTGHTLMTILKDLVGQVMTEAFDCTRPLIPFCFSAIMQRRNNIFELCTVAPIHDINQCIGAIDSMEEEKEGEGTRLRLRGQMLYMEDWGMMLYLANPVMPDLGALVDCSLFINDLSLHDCSRDLVLAGTQQSVELKLALDQEQQKSKKLVQSMKKLDEEMRRTDELLYQMIPKQIADRIRKGENPVETCQTFESVSVLFTDVVNFTMICSKITPLQVVSMLNHMYFLFDQLSERNSVYKVETVGDSYMVVSGAPVPNLNHAERICDMALDIIDASEAIEDPSGKDSGLRVRVGCHSGACVAGVVGIKMPRYCLFGDTINTASRMESTAEPGRVQISEACKKNLPNLYSFELRGTVSVKGKGEMNTYWLISREARVPLSKYYSKTIIWTPTTKLLEGIGGRPPSPITASKQLERLESITSVNSSTSASGKNQRVAATFKNSALRVKPQLQFKFAKRSTKASLSSADSIRSTTNNSPTQMISCDSPPESSKVIDSMKTEDDKKIESVSAIQHYLNKYAETKRLEISAQEKTRQQKIAPTSIYDSDLINEAFQTPLGKSHNYCSKGVPEVQATMIMAGIIPESVLPNPQTYNQEYKNKLQASSRKKDQSAIPTSVGEGLLTEYIIAIEKSSHENSAKKANASKESAQLNEKLVTVEEILNFETTKNDVDEHSAKAQSPPPSEKQDDDNSKQDKAKVTTSCMIEDDFYDWKSPRQLQSIPYKFGQFNRLSNFPSRLAKRNSKPEIIKFGQHAIFSSTGNPTESHYQLKRESENIFPPQGRLLRGKDFSQKDNNEKMTCGDIVQTSENNSEQKSSCTTTPIKRIFDSDDEIEIKPILPPVKESDSDDEKSKLDPKKLGSVLIGNKLAEVRVEKWIREEFADSNQCSIEEEESDDGLLTDHFSQLWDEKWIHDDDEKWIKEEFPGDKDADLNQHGQQQTSGTDSKNISPKKEKEKFQEKKAISRQSSTSKEQGKEIEVKEVNIEIKCVSPKKSKNQEDLSITKPIAKIPSPRSRELQKDKSETLLTVTKGYVEEFVKSHYVKVPASKPDLDHTPNVDIVTYESPKMERVLKAMDMDLEEIEAVEEVSKTSRRSSTLESVFSGEFGTVYSADLEKIQKNCTTFCYDCLSSPSYVDNDLELQLPTERKRHAAGESEKGSQSGKNSKERMVKKRILTLFNRLH